MKKMLIGLLLFSVNAVSAQQQYSDSLKQAFLSAKQDSSKVITLASLSSYYSYLYPDSGVYYADKIIELSTQDKYEYGKALGFIYKGDAILMQGDFTTSIQLAYKSLNMSKELKEHRFYMLSLCYQLIGKINGVNGYPVQSVNYLYKSIDLQKQSGKDTNDIYKSYFNLAFSMLIQDKKDSAMFFVKKGWDLFSITDNKRDILPWIVSGNVHRSFGDFQEAEAYFREGIQKGKAYNSFFYVAAISNDLSDLFYDKGMRDSCLKYVHQCLSLSQKYQYKVFEMYSSGFLYFIYDSLSRDSTLKYIKIYNAARDEVYSQEKIRQFQATNFDEEKKERDLEDAKKDFQNKLKMYAIFGIAAVFLVIAFILFRNNRHKQKANKVLEATLTHLKSTQSQLIQSEKMASLGELTAGIAHEIQNPLNFVNNFSEVNKELISELVEEVDKGNTEEVKVIANDIKENSEKINHHGKRAEAIVKGMLQHSRSSSGLKEPTNINALADESLRLSYHGLRAKDKSFNAEMKTDFDESIGNINIIPQDIGRVLLNLYNNAFYAVSKPSNSLKGEQYKPLVTVKTRKVNSPLGVGGIEISVKDNGNGIPQKIVDKIFQPFFTTKPTGQGTGLGLSLSYDIVKAHGGEIKVETKEGEGTTFIIQLPVS